MELVEKEVNEILNDELGCPSYEMATVGYFYEKKGNKPQSDPIKVSVTDDAGKPQVHVHLIRKTGKSLKCCIKLDAPEYFSHGQYTDHLSKDQIKCLIDFFKSKPDQPRFSFNHTEYKLRTNWDYTVIQWNVENQLTPNVWIPISIDKSGYIITPEMPDYTKLNDYTTVETTGLADALRKAAEELSGELGEEVDFEQTVYGAEACEKRNIERERWLPVFSEQKKELLRLAAEFNPFDFSYTENLIFQAVKINYEYFKRPNLVEFDTSDTKYDKMIESFEKLLVYIKIIESEDSENATAARKKFYACLADNIETWWD